MSEPKRRRRGPKRTDGEQLEALTIRLPPKLKLGLDLLARLQGRSLSQAVEWSLQQALLSVRVGDISLLDLTAKVINCQGPERAERLYKANPALLPFEERHAIELILSSKEGKYIESGQWEALDHERVQEVLKGYQLVIGFLWPRLLGDANTLEIAAKQASGKRSLSADCGILPGDVSKSIEETIVIAARRLERSAAAAGLKR